MEIALFRLRQNSFAFLSAIHLMTLVVVKYQPLKILMFGSLWQKMKGNHSYIIISTKYEMPLNNEFNH